MKVLLCLFSVMGILAPKNALGPWDLTYPGEWIDSPVTLSKCHGNETVHLTLKFSCPVKIKKGVVVYVEVFGEIYEGLLSYYNDMESGETVNVEVNKVFTPNEAGVYYLGVYVRSGEKGQILAQNYRYTTVGVCEKKSEFKELGVEVIGLEKWGQSFGVDLEYIAQQRVETGYILLVIINDLFILDESTEFSISSNSTTELKSEKFVKTKYNEFGFVFMNSIPDTPTSFHITIRNILNSGYPIANSISVQVDIIENTKNRVTEWFFKTKDISIQGLINIASWAKANFDSNADKIAKGIVTYTKLSFSCTNQIYPESKISISFSDISLSDYSYLADSYQRLTSLSGSPYISSNLQNLSCQVVEASEIECELSSMLASETEIIIYTLTHFTGDAPKIDRITTFDNYSNIIDATSSEFAISYNEDLVLIDDEPECYFTSKLNESMPTSLTGSQQGALYISLRLANNMKDSDIITVSPLFFDYESRLINTIRMSSSLTTYYYLSSEPNYNFYTYSMFSKSPIIEQGTLTMYLDSADSSADMWINILVFSGSSDNLNDVILPHFASDINTRHELTIKFKGSSTEQIFSKPFTVFYSQFYNYTFNQVSNSYESTSKIVKLELDRKLIIPETDEYKLIIRIRFISEYEISEDLKSGLGFGQDYPVNGISDGDSFTLIKPLNNERACLQLTKKSGFSSAPFIIYFPYPEYTLDSYIETQVYIQDSTNNLYLDSTGTVNLYIYAYEADSGSYDKLIVMAEQIIDEIIIESDSTNTNFLQIIFPPGFYLGDNVKILNSSDVEASNVTVFKENKNFFKYPTLLVLTDSEFFKNSKIKITNVKSGKFIGDYAIYATFGPDLNTIEEENLYGDYKLSIKVNRKKNLRLNDLSPEKSLSAGADFQVFNTTFTIRIPIELEFTSDHLIYIEKFSDMGNILACKIYSSTYNFTISISQKSCNGHIIKPVSTNSLSVEMSFIPPTNYETSLLSPLSVLEIRLNSLPIYDINTLEYNWLIEFSPSTPSVHSNVVDLKIFPDFPSDEKSDFFIKFIPQFDVHEGSIVKVQGEYFENDLKISENTWITEGFTSAEISMGNLKLTTSSLIKAQTEVYITKKSAFRVSKSGYSELFFVSVTKNEIYIIEDTVLNSNSIQRYLFKGLPTGNITDLYFEKTTKSAYEQSLFKFRFKLDFDLVQDYSIIFKFPKTNFQFLGPGSQIYKLDSGVYYLNRVSEQVDCVAAAWTLMCRWFQIQPAKTEIYLEAFLYNPVNATDYKIDVFIVDSSDTIVANDSIIDSYTIEHSEQILEDLLVQVEDTIKYSSPYNISIEPGFEITEIYKILLKFPSEFQISINNPTISCNLQVSEETFINCSTFLDYIEIQLSSPINITENSKILIKLSEIIKPYSDFTINSNEKNSPNYWTGQISLQIFSTGTNIVTHSTPPNLNAAYLSYSNSYHSSIKVTCKDNENFVILKPQTYTKCTFSVNSMNLFANSIEIFPLSDLTFDQFSYTLTRDFPSVSFKIGAPYFFTQGLYYINWEFTENSLVKNHFIYEPMRLTQVQIFSDLKAEISVNYQNLTINRQTSYPISLTMGEFFPFDPIYISISISPMESQFKLDSNVIVFSSSKNSAYFKLTIDESEKKVADDKIINLKFKLTGKYSEAYEIPNNIKYMSIMETKTNEVSFDLSNVYNETSCSTLFYLDLNDSAIVTWSFGPSLAYLNEEYYTYNYISNQVYPLNGSSSGTQSSFEDLLSLYTQYLNSIKANTWEDLQTSKKDYINSIIFYKQSYLTPGSHLLFDSFFTIPTIKYTLTLWIDNFTNNSKVQLYTQVISEFNEHCSVSVVTDKNLSDPNFFLPFL